MNQTPRRNAALAKVRRQFSSSTGGNGSNSNSSNNNNSSNEISSGRRGNAVFCLNGDDDNRRGRQRQQQRRQPAPGGSGTGGGGPIAMNSTPRGAAAKRRRLIPAPPTNGSSLNGSSGGGGVNGINGVNGTSNSFYEPGGFASVSKIIKGFTPCDPCPPPFSLAQYGEESLYTLVLLRHGESEWNVQNRYTGWADVDLSRTGELEARTAGRLLYENNIELDMAFTSVLKRASFSCNMALNMANQHWVPGTTR